MPEIRILSWNIDGVRTHDKELFHLLSTHRLDIAVLCETRADTRPKVAKIWPGTRVEQILPTVQRCSPASAGTAMIIKQVGEALLLKIIAIFEEDNNGLTQAIKVKVDQNIGMVGIYVGPQTSGKKMGDVISNMYRGEESRLILVGDINAIHISWDNAKNTRGREVVRIPRLWNYKISTPEGPS